MTSTAAKSSRLPVVQPEAEDTTDDDSPQLPCLVFALRNAFINLDDAELEFELAIERRRRRVPFIHALRNAFLHVEEQQFEAEIAMEKQRRRALRKKSTAREAQIIINTTNNSSKNSKVGHLSDVQAKLDISKSNQKLAPATVENVGDRKSASSSNNETTAASVISPVRNNEDNNIMETTKMMASMDPVRYTDRIPLKVAKETGQLGRWHREHGNNNIIITTPTTTTSTNSSDTLKLPHLATSPGTAAPAPAVGGGEITTLMNKKRLASFDDDANAETEIADDETETEIEDEGEEETVEDDDDSSWNSTDSGTATGLGSKTAAYTSKFFVGTPLPAITTRGHSVHQPLNENVNLWTEGEDICLKKIMKKYSKATPPRDWEVIAKELGRSRTGKECHERWILRHHLNTKGGFRKTWTKEEDTFLIQQVMGSEEQPFSRWAELAIHFPGRNSKQLRDRFKNCLNPCIRHYPFSRDEDILLYTAHQAVGPRWVDVSLQFFKSTRSENQVKNRWNSAAYKKFVAEEFGPSTDVCSKSSTQSWTEQSPKKKMARLCSSIGLIESTRASNGLGDMT